MYIADALSEQQITALTAEAQTLGVTAASVRHNLNTTRNTQANLGQNLHQIQEELSRSGDTARVGCVIIL